MAESLSNSTGVSRQIYTDIKSAFRSYAQNSNKFALSQNDDNKVYTNRGQVTRKAYYDIQNNLAEQTKTNEKQETEKAANEEQTDTNLQINNKTQEQASTDNKETKTYTLPKNTDTILAELKRNGLSRTKTFYQIAEEYGISYMKAREILDKLNTDRNGFIREYHLPENSTLSYKV